MVLFGAFSVIVVVVIGVFGRERNNMSLGGWEVGQIWKKLEEGKEYDQNIMFEKNFQRK